MIKWTGISVFTVTLVGNNYANEREIAMLRSADEPKHNHEADRNQLTDNKTTNSMYQNITQNGL